MHLRGSGRGEVGGRKDVIIFHKNIHSIQNKKLFPCKISHWRGLRESKRLEVGRGECNITLFQLKTFKILRNDHTKTKTLNLLWVTHTPVDSPVLMHIGTALRGMSGL